MWISKIDEVLHHNTVQLHNKYTYKDCHYLFFVDIFFPFAAKYIISFDVVSGCSCFKGLILFKIFKRHCQSYIWRTKILFV